MQEWLRMAGGHNKVEYCSGSHLKESSFRSKDLSLALALSLGRGVTGQTACCACCNMLNCVLGMFAQDLTK